MAVCANVYADSDYTNDYTFIDCVNGDDTTAVPFDSSKPYGTLAGWIEATINYINSDASIKTATWAVFHIKASCNIIRNTPTNVSINFQGALYDNHLIIEGYGEEGLVLSDVVFNLGAYDIGNVTFRNVKFIKNSILGYYFTRNEPTIRGSSTTLWIQIKDSYIHLYPNTQLDNNPNSRICWSWNWVQQWPNTCGPWRVSQLYIANSLIDIDAPTTDSYQFFTPSLIKDSKITFWTGLTSSNIFFTKQEDWWSLDYAILMSDEIKLGGNNFWTFTGWQNITYINNKFTELHDFNADAWLLLNNLIENNTNGIDISNNKNVYNNVFQWGFIDNSDPNHLRKNYDLNSVWPKWVGWIFRKVTWMPKDFRLSYSSTSLYKEITGKDIPNAWSAIYLLFD